MLHILILNGPNLNLVGEREPQIYGNQSLNDYILNLKSKYSEVANLTCLQSNHEGALIDAIQAHRKSDGIIINAGGYAHSSIAIRDAISSTYCPVIEVHISNIYAREAFRHHSLLTGVSKGLIAGLGIDGYELALQWLIQKSNVTL